jgi:hypothetical protein
LASNWSGADFGAPVRQLPACHMFYKGTHLDSIESKVFFTIYHDSFVGFEKNLHIKRATILIYLFNYNLGLEDGQSWKLCYGFRWGRVWETLNKTLQRKTTFKTSLSIFKKKTSQKTFIGKKPIDMKLLPPPMSSSVCWPNCALRATQETNPDFKIGI